MRYILGVDSGATKTHAGVADETGKILGHAKSGPSSIKLQTEKDFKTELLKVKNSGADVLYFPVYPTNAVAAFKQMKEINFDLIDHFIFFYAYHPKKLTKYSHSWISRYEPSFFCLFSKTLLIQCRFHLDTYPPKHMPIQNYHAYEDLRQSSEEFLKYQLAFRFWNL